MFILDDSTHHDVSSVPMQEIVCPLCSEAESKGVEIGVVDGHRSNFNSGDWSVCNTYLQLIPTLNPNHSQSVLVANL